MSDPDSRADKPDATDTEETFLERWSRRKQAAQRQSDGSAEEETTAEAAERDAENSGDRLDAADLAAGRKKPAAAEAPEPEPPGDEDMPPLETIDKGGSVAEFLSPNVSKGLRKAAMRRLFSQPQFGAVDMLDDYAKDYTNRAPLGDIVTADMRYRAEQAAKRLARKAAESLEAESTGESVGIDERPQESAVDPESATAAKADADPIRTQKPADPQSDTETDTTEDENDQRPA